MLAAPRISVVIPSYNHERFIGEALTSVQTQSFQDFEVLVIDDGSSDASAQIAEAVAATDSRIRVIRQRNAGSHGAINKGLSLARGEWIAILNSDDRFAPDRLARMLAAGDEGAWFITGEARLIDNEGAEITDPSHWWHRTVADFLAKVDQYGPIQGLMYGNYTISTSNFFFRRALVDEIGTFAPLRRVIDWEWALRAALKRPHEFRLLREKLLDYRLHGANAILGDPMRGTLEIARVHRRVLRALGVPDPLQASLVRNRRELRRAWRDRAVARIEHFVREREADVRAVALERDRIEQHAADIETRTTEALGRIRALEADKQELVARLTRIERSLPYRLYRLARRLAGGADR
ncbi:MAG TPA: glycosyltransferase [Burkholderiaceae bacterium]|nr:glycosyltransferase [Burkholderiaceae bacterium]